MALPTKLTLEIVTPDRALVAEPVDEVELPGSEGYFGVLPGHTPLLASLSVGELIVRAAAVYFVLFVLLRFIGKKHVGELSPFDLVVLLIISETVDGSLIGSDGSLIGGLISAATLVLIVQVVSYLAWRSKTVERILEGTPRILVRHGRVNKEILDKEQITRSELIEALRHEGHTCITKVRFAVLENDGTITIGVDR